MLLFRQELNVGVDLELFDDLNIAVDWFHEYRNNIFMQRKSFASHGGVGSSLPWANLGETVNSGVDFSVNFSNIRETMVITKSIVTYETV